MSRQSVEADVLPPAAAYDRRIRVLIADDHAILRSGLKALLSAADGVEVVGEASDGRDAVRRTLALKPDVLLVDISMPTLNGIDAVRVLRRLRAEVRVVILTMHSTSEHVHSALSAGADAYVLKTAAATELIRAVRAVHVGKRFFSPEVDQVNREILSGHPSGSPAGRLSARERQVLQLVVEGRTSREIAAIVHLSPKSVDTYRSRLMKKLGVPNLPALIKFAVQHGLTSI